MRLIKPKVQELIGFRISVVVKNTASCQRALANGNIYFRFSSHDILCNLMVV